MVALTRFVHVTPIQLASGHLLNPLDSLQHGNAVRAAAPQVVHLAGPWISGKLLDRAYHVMTVNIVAHLLALVAKYGISAAAECDLHKIRQKAMQLHAGVRWPRQAAASKDPYFHVEVAPI